MIQIQIIIRTIHRKYFNEYVQVYTDRVRVLQSRTHKNKSFGQRDFITLQGNIIHMFQFIHFLGNKHCHIGVVTYNVTPYPLWETVTIKK